MNIDDILEQRQNSYGNFADRAEITQNIKTAMRNGQNYQYLSAEKKESLEMIAAKIGRILNGDSDHYDSWKDIEGYARLVSDELKPLK
jgi:hypothetical protein